MDEIKSALDRIEAELGKKPPVPAWVSTVAVPLLIATLSSLITIYGVTKTLTSGDRANTLKQVEVLQTVIKDFSPDYPERTLVLLDVVQSVLPMEEAISKKLRAYATTQTTRKLDAALQKGGERGAEQVNEVLTAVSASDAAAARQITSKISSGLFHVIVASDTTRSLADNFKAQLISAGYKAAVVIETSNRFAVSLGEFPFQEAALKRDAFQTRARFHPAYANLAFLERAKPGWKVAG